MKPELERTVILEKREVSDGSHPWCLKEIGLDETKYTERWVPARGTYYFTASNIALNTSLSNDSSKKTSEQSLLDEVIVAKLYPGILRDGSLQDNFRFSTLGTNYPIEVFQFYLKSHGGNEADNKCYIRKAGGGDHTRRAAIDLEIHLSLPIERFEVFRQMILAKALDTFELILIGVSGFYKDEFSIGTDRGVLTNDVRRSISTGGSSKGDQEYNPEDIGKVREWDVSLEYRLKLEKFATFIKTDHHGNPSVDDRYVERSVKPYLKGMQEREDHHQDRSDLFSIIMLTAKKVAEYSNSVSESRVNYRKRLADAIDVVQSIQSAINEAPIPEIPAEQNNGKQKEIEHSHSEETIWKHGNLQAAYQGGWESVHHKNIDKVALEHEAVRYLQRPWMWNDQLEWVMIDALMFCEVIEFGEYIKQNDPGYMNSRGTNTAYFSAKGNLKKMAWMKRKNQIMNSARELLLVIVFPLALIFYFWDFQYQDVIFWSAAIYFISLALYSMTKFIGDSRDDNLDTVHEERYSQLLAMRNIYAELYTGVINPSYLRGRLLDSASRGVVWSGAIFSLIDNVVERSPVIWTHRGDPYKDP